MSNMNNNVSGMGVTPGIGETYVVVQKKGLGFVAWATIFSASLSAALATVVAIEAHEEINNLQRQVDIANGKINDLEAELEEAGVLKRFGRRVRKTFDI